MRKLIAGNWKMNGLASSLAEIEALKGLTGQATCDIVVCPPFTLIEKAVAVSSGSAILVGAQDCHAQSTGAYTGDVSAEMLAETGARFVILGHSERRSAYREADASVAAKAAAAHKTGLTIIICVGETREERDDGTAIEVVRAQLEGSIPEGARSANTAIAYEPVWAIGTGLIPTVEQIERSTPRFVKCSKSGRPLRQNPLWRIGEGIERCCDLRGPQRRRSPCRRRVAEGFRIRRNHFCSHLKSSRQQ